MKHAASHWLNRERFTRYPRLFLLLFIVLGIAWALLAKNHVDLKGKPLGYDFITFWAASYLGLHNHAPLAYDLASIFRAEQAAVPASNSVFVWYYPPTFYVLILPLALLAYFPAYWTFMLLTLAAYVCAMRRIVRTPDAMWCLAAFSGAWMNLFHGQNAFLTAALAAAALLCLEKRPVLAGVFIGLLAIKPHLALLFPIALIAIGAWRTFVVAAATAILFMVISTAIMGTDTLMASVHSLGYARLFLETGTLPWPKMPTVFAFLRLLGTPVSLAYAVHAAVALVAIRTVWRIWRGSQDQRLRAAALMTGTFLVSPYVFDYDLAWLAFPIAWLALCGLETGWRTAEREILAAAWLLPLIMAPFATPTHIQLGPIVLGALLWITWRRARSPYAASPSAASGS